MPRDRTIARIAGLQQQHMNIESDVLPLLASYRRTLRAAGKSQATIDHYIGASQQFLKFAEVKGFPDIAGVRREHVETWLVAMRDAGAAPHSVKNRFVGLRRWLKWLVEEGELRSNPVERIPMPGVDEAPKDVVPEAQMASIVSALDKASRVRDASWLIARDVAVVSWFYGTGARVTETCMAQLRNVDLDKGRCWLEGETTKAGEGRMLGLSPRLVDALDRYLRKRGQDDCPNLFVNQRHMPLTRSGMYWLVRAVFAETGRAIGPHDLRHTSATHVAEAGVMGELEMAGVYGWEDLEMAKHYTKQARQKMAAKSQQTKSPLDRLGR